MPEFPYLENAGIHRSAGAVLATARGIVVTTSATANTKGSYAELTAATAKESNFLTVQIQGGNVVANYLVDIAVGAGGSERIVINNLLVQPSHVTQTGYCYQFPLSIAEGVRISARAQSSVATANTLNVSVILSDASWSSFPQLQSVETFGATTASSSGSIVDPGATAFTKGAYTQLIASTSHLDRWLTLGWGRLATTGTVAISWQLDIAIGAAASERVIIQDIAVDFEATADMPAPLTINFPVSIPTGSRVSARAACLINTTTTRNLNVIAYGTG